MTQWASGMFIGSWTLNATTLFQVSDLVKTRATQLAPDTEPLIVMTDNYLGRDITREELVQMHQRQIRDLTIRSSTLLYIHLSTAGVELSVSREDPLVERVLDELHRTARRRPIRRRAATLATIALPVAAAVALVLGIATNAPLITIATLGLMTLIALSVAVISIGWIATTGAPNYSPTVINPVTWKDVLTWRRTVIVGLGGAAAGALVTGIFCLIT